MRTLAELLSMSMASGIDIERMLNDLLSGELDVSAINDPSIAQKYKVQKEYPDNGKGPSEEKP